jgi:hypothetical protein
LRQEVLLTKCQSLTLASSRAGYRVFVFAVDADDGRAQRSHGLCPARADVAVEGGDASAAEGTRSVGLAAVLMPSVATHTVT